MIRISFWLCALSLAVPASTSRASRRLLRIRGEGSEAFCTDNLRLQAAGPNVFAGSCCVSGGAGGASNPSAQYAREEEVEQPLRAARASRPLPSLHQGQLCHLLIRSSSVWHQFLWVGSLDDEERREQRTFRRRDLSRICHAAQPRGSLRPSSQAAPLALSITSTRFDFGTQKSLPGKLQHKELPQLLRLKPRHLAFIFVFAAKFFSLRLDNSTLGTSSKLLQPSRASYHLGLSFVPTGAFLCPTRESPTRPLLSTQTTTTPSFERRKLAFNTDLFLRGERSSLQIGNQHTDLKSWSSAFRSTRFEVEEWSLTLSFPL